MENSVPAKKKNNTWKWIAGGILGWFILAGVFGGESKESTTKDKQVPLSSGVAETAAKPELDEVAMQITTTAEAVKKFKQGGYESKDMALLQAALFSAWAKTVQDGKASPKKDVQQEATKLEKAISKIQKAEFPKLRKAYGKDLKENLWENNIKVSTSGADAGGIMFVGGVFANNKNIKEFETTIYEQLQTLRFRKSEYKWFSQADEWTVFNKANPKDGQLVP